MIRVTVEEVSDDYKSQRTVCFFEAGNRRMVTPDHEDFLIMYQALNGLIYETSECQKSKTTEKKGAVGRPVGQEDSAPEAQEGHTQDESCPCATSKGLPETEARVEKGPREPDLQGLSSPFNGTPPFPWPPRPSPL